MALLVLAFSLVSPLPFRHPGRPQASTRVSLSVTTWGGRGHSRIRVWATRHHTTGFLVSWGQRLQESSWQEKDTKNNPERESPERGTGKWGAESLSEQGNSDASLTAQAWACVCTDAHTLHIPPYRQHITHINPLTLSHHTLSYTVYPTLLLHIHPVST